MAREIDLTAEVQKILNDYGNDVTEHVKQITREIAKKGAAKVRSNARSKLKQHTGKYAKGWTYKVENRRYAPTATIYDKVYQLPHLLEHGHANRGGGRTKGIEHIKSVEEELTREFTEAVKKKL